MSSVLDFERSYEALRNDAVAAVVSRDIVTVHGADTRSFLEGQCSQHVSELSVGDSAPTLLLSPQGKIDVLGDVAMIADDTAVVVVEAGYGETTFERLRRFKLRVKVELALESVSAVLVRGPNAAIPTDPPMPCALVTVRWPGFSGYDVVGEGAAAPLGCPNGSLAALEVGRIEAGIPAMGRELTEKTIPQEAGITGYTVSFSKGCYTGQELVARIDARGNRVPRNLRAVIFDAPKTLPIDYSGAEVIAEGRSVGELTSVGYSPRTNGIVSLAYVRREVEPPSDATIRVDNTEIPAKIEMLPLV